MSAPHVSDSLGEEIRRNSKKYKQTIQTMAADQGDFDLGLDQGAFVAGIAGDSKPAGQSRSFADMVRGGKKDAGGEYKITDLEHDYFIVRFEKKSDYTRILEGGPWIIGGHYLMKMGSHLGRVIKIDTVTWEGSRGRFAKVCVELDLTKPLLPFVIVEGKSVNMEYEGLSLICFECDIFGHRKDECLKLQSLDKEDVIPKKVPETPMEKEEQGFGPWMLVQRRRRFPAKSKFGGNKEGAEVTKERETRSNSRNSKDHVNKKSGVTKALLIEKGTGEANMGFMFQAVGLNIGSNYGPGKKGSNKGALNFANVKNKGVVSPTTTVNGNQQKGRLVVIQEEENTLSTSTSSEDVVIVEDTVVDSMADELAGQPSTEQIGVCYAKFSRTVKELIKDYRPDILCLLETKADTVSVERVGRFLKFSSLMEVPADGFAGGLALYWKAERVNLSIIGYMEQCIHTEVEVDSVKQLFSFAYVRPNGSWKDRFWRELRVFSNSVSIPWSVIGDFNDFAAANEKWGGNNSSDVFRRIVKFRERWDSCSLIDLDSSDTDCVPLAPKENRPFRFEAAWLVHPEFKHLFATAWNKGAGSLISAIEQVSTEVRVWKEEVFGNIYKRKRILVVRIRGIQQSPDYGRSSFLQELELCLQQEFHDVLRQEEVLWLQKSRLDWVLSGECNTKFFHLTTLMRRQQNTIASLKVDNVWVRDQEALGRHVVEYFNSFFAWQRCESFAPVYDTYSIVLNDEEQQHLCRAEENQIAVVRDVLSNFSKASGLHVNLDKSKLWVSPNVPRVKTQCLSRLCEIPLAAELGRYLGVPIIHGRVTKNTYNHAVDKVINKLASWKGKVLSYTVSVVDRLDQCNQNFLWSGEADKSGGHLVSWERLCRPKRNGGLGLRKARVSYVALLAKTSWKLQMREQNLCTEIFQKKYLKGKPFIESSSSRRCSSTWRGLLHTRDCIRRGTRWWIGNGIGTRFWTDWKGIVSKPLCRLCSSAVESAEHIFRMCPFAVGIWECVGRRFGIVSDESLDFTDWLMANGSNKVQVRNGIYWNYFFPALLWGMWKARNEFIFNATGPVADQIISYAFKLALEAGQVFSPNKVLAGTSGQMIKWQHPPAGCFLLNSDGSRRHSDKHASARGLIRDAVGLLIAKERGCMPLIVELDAAVVVNFLKTSMECLHPCYTLGATSSSGFFRKVSAKGPPVQSKPFIEIKKLILSLVWVKLWQRSKDKFKARRHVKVANQALEHLGDQTKHMGFQRSHVGAQLESGLPQPSHHKRQPMSLPLEASLILYRFGDSSLKEISKEEELEDEFVKSFLRTRFHPSVLIENFPSIAPAELSDEMKQLLQQWATEALPGLLTSLLSGMLNSLCYRPLDSASRDNIVDPPSSSQQNDIKRNGDGDGGDDDDDIEDLR
ncbi:Endonuclease/exonuclease/phosphatase [Corchorus capsularis]|uniref:Endonuclease/exonuclease/phosphatase n=1 Tax=Corchorus capsularis TaxID=210143 RepID=A0A1R3HPC2_COCAP|nr:Endonuclease/exonuclease/phosphatase [Corchorus capsularis]